MRRALTSALAPVLVLAALTAGCSSAAPLTGPSSPPAAVAPSATGPSGSAGQQFTGLSAACTAVLDAQVAIADLFARPVDGHTLSRADVRTTFDKLGPAIPHELDGAVTALRDAATRSVAKSAVDVAAILAEKRVMAALADLSTYVKGCTPPTS